MSFFDVLPNPEVTLEGVTKATVGGMMSSEFEQTMLGEYIDVKAYQY